MVLEQVISLFNFRSWMFMTFLLKSKDWNIYYFRIILSIEKSEIKSAGRLIVIYKVKSCWLSCNNMKCRLVDFPAMIMIFLLYNIKLLTLPQWQQLFNIKINNSMRLTNRQKKLTQSPKSVNFQHTYICLNLSLFHPGSSHKTLIQDII